MRLWKIGAGVVACAACCAPVIAPLFAGTAFVGAGAVGVGYFESIELGIIGLAFGLAGLWLYRRSPRAAKTKCGCSPGFGYNTGTSCDVPQAKQITAI